MGHPLDGVRILELGQIIAGTYGGQVLSDLGAEVIKIEAPGGDLGRIPSVAPFKGQSGLFLTFNRNKKSVVIDLKAPQGLDVFQDLVRVCDVVIDNFRPGVLERLKIDYDRLKSINPRIIQCSVTGFGATGVYKDLPALDIIIQSISGHMAITGEAGRPPARAGVPLADLSGGIFSCKGILAALYQRERTGEGCRLELSMFDGMLNLLSYIGTMWLSQGELPQPQGSAHEYTVPWQAFPTKDDYIVIACRQDNFWRNLSAAIGRPEWGEDQRFATNAARIANRDIIVPLLTEILATRTAKEWVGILREAQVPVAPVNNLDGAFAEPPVGERQMVVDYDHPQVGQVRLPGNPIKFEGVEGPISRPAPMLGEHTGAVLSELLGLAPERIASLREAGVVS